LSSRIDILRRLSIELIDCQTALIPGQFLKGIDLEAGQNLLRGYVVGPSEVQQIFDLFRRGRSIFLILPFVFA